MGKKKRRKESERKMFESFKFVPLSYKSGKKKEAKTPRKASCPGLYCALISSSPTPSKSSVRLA